MSDSSDPMNCSLPGSSVHGIFQARVLEWGAIAFSKETSSHSHSVVFLYFFALIAEEGFLISSCYSLELCIQMLGPSNQIRSVTQSCPTLWDPMNRSTPGLPVHHQLPEFTQTQVHRVSDAIQPSHPLSSPSPLASNPSQHQSLFQ